VNSRPAAGGTVLAFLSGMGAFTSQDPMSRNGSRPLAPAPALAPAAPRPTVGFHGAVSEFKRRLIEATLAQAGGNRTRAAKALGLQRTYLLRLMREFQIRIPPSAPPRRSDAGPGALPPQTR
jgi:DNA-binding NtrC family response regulator